MKLLYSLSRSGVALIFLLQLTGCQKLIDKIFRDHDDHDPDCVISEITQVREEVTRTATFYNNSHGNPDSVIFDTPIGSAGAQLHYFRYDEHHRLIGYDAYYDRGPDNYFFKHTYRYDDRGRIIRDTIRISQAGRFTSVYEIDYDNEGRVMAEFGRVIEAGGDSITDSDLQTKFYELDIRENLIFHNSRYDDKINFLRTSNVLMFIERNYSRNNPIQATGYNNRKLPLGFAGLAHFPTSNWGILGNIPPSHIEYDCH